jgi:hypothetical protein
LGQFENRVLREMQDAGLITRMLEGFHSLQSLPVMIMVKEDEIMHGKLKFEIMK